jgi:predicted glycogen debranching enzyme
LILYPSLTLPARQQGLGRTMPAVNEKVTHQMPWRSVPISAPQQLLDKEWLVTNGLGGYSSGTLPGVPTRSYHGLLIAALPAPLGRTLLLGPISEQVRLPDGRTVRFRGAEYAGGRLELEGVSELLEFSLDAGLPVWRYQIGSAVLERRLWMPHRLNIVVLRYRLLAGSERLRLKLLPAVHFRACDAPVSTPLPAPFRLEMVDGRVDLSGRGGLPPLRMTIEGERTAFTVEGPSIRELLYRTEAARGYISSGELYSPGYFRADLVPDRPVTFIATCEPWEIIDALPVDEAERAERERRERLLDSAHPATRQGVGAELVLAADQFLITPVGRVEETAPFRAAGDEARTVIAGYHWFTDWGRDSMIALEGLTLTTGRHVEAGYILRTFAHHVRDGLIPDFFPDGQTEGLYHTADASLWFFQATHRYLEATQDRGTLRLLLPKLRGIVEHHLKGTRFGIGVDPQDGLLRQGAPGYQLTWMDAKVGDWVVTPRRGKAVEINALWYNALCLLRGWLEEENEPEAASALAPSIDQARASFNKRFWNQQTGYLLDVVDGEQGDDPACRPNQLLAISLRYPVLEESRWKAILDAVQQKLLTPVGLRSLAPGHPDYKPKYDGDLRARDAAYHQGTVWAWLIGPFVDAWLRVHPEDRAGARRFLSGLVPHLGEACIGSISEIFDAEPPYTPRGCIAQAWSVAEMLRCWALTAEG